MAARASSLSPAVSSVPLRSSSTKFFKPVLAFSFHPQSPRPHGPPSSSRVFAAPELVASTGTIDSSGSTTEAAEGSALEDEAVTSHQGISNSKLFHLLPKDSPRTSKHRVLVKNDYGETLVGILHETHSKELVILCHGFRSSKESMTLLKLVDALTKKGVSVFRFDFSGNGESEGSFQFGNYWKEVDDLHAVILHFLGQNQEISAIVGHSKGGNVVLLYASTYHDISTVVNISGRFALGRGIEKRLGKDFIERIKKDGFIDVKDQSGELLYRVTEKSLMDRLTTDMQASCALIDKNCKVLTVHGSADETVPVEDAMEFAKLIPNHNLQIIEGADHRYTWHQVELTSTVLKFISE